jgi:hypothetical protein
MCEIQKAKDAKDAKDAEVAGNVNWKIENLFSLK